MQIRAAIIAGLLSLIISQISIARQAEDTGYVHKIISIETDGGREVPAILTHPKSGVNPYAPAFVHHHGGPGGNPVNFSGAPRFFARGAAKAGYTSISLLSHHSRYYFSAKFETTVEDIKAAVDFLDDYGIENIMLTGHSLGGIRVTRYLTETKDARVKALVQFAPTRDMPEWSSGAMGKEEYDKFVANAESLVAQGKQKQFVTMDLSPPPPWPPGFTVQFTHTAEAFLDWWGPNAKTYNSRLIAEIEQPILLVSGDQDGFVYPEYPQELKKAAVASSQVDVILYKDVGHIFEENRPQVISDALNWVDKLGYGPRPEINIDLVDTTTEKGTLRSGVIYTPADGENKNKPAFLLLHGWSGDVMWSSNHWLGVRLAQAGYTAVAMRIGASGRRGITSKPLMSVVDDIGGWSSFLGNRGYQRIIGEGHSMGGIWWTTYVNQSKDQSIKGVVYLAPTRDMSKNLQAGLKDKEPYEILVNTAREAVANGKGKSVMISADLLEKPEHKRQYPFFQYADAFLSYWAPESKSVHTTEIKEVELPIFALAGSKDALVSAGFLDEFADAAGGKAKTAVYPGAPHSLAGAEDDVSNDIIDWTKKHFK